MGDYNHESGVFTLTLAEAREFHHTRDRPEDPPPMDYYAEKLQQIGFDVVSISEDALEVKASPDEVWEVLSGQTPFL